MPVMALEDVIIVLVLATLEKMVNAQDVMGLENASIAEAQEDCSQEYGLFLIEKSIDKTIKL